MERKYDFSGWATRNDMLCSDGRTIRKDAFKHNDGKRVPLVWNHQHNDSMNILGHAMLENRPEGVYAYGVFNNTESGQNAKALVEHGDVSGLSIYANKLKQKAGNVLHGEIRELSLVLAGANPGAFIDSVIRHSDGTDSESEDEAIIYTGEDISLSHSDEVEEEPEVAEVEAEKEQELEHAEESEKTVQDVFDTMNEEQKTVVYAMLAEMMKDQEDPENEEDEEEAPAMKHNVFDQDQEELQANAISHADMKKVIDDAKRFGSMKEAALQHGITDIEFLFPDAKNLNVPPAFIQRDTGWVGEVMQGTHHTPFSRIKSMFADITEDDARAKGYIKGNLKKEEVFSLLKRTTTPQTVYKKQKLDRDDIIDITDFDVVAWLKTEMRMMLDEEIARAVLVGDGRLASSDDKIKEDNIRPIWKDADLYTIKVEVKVPANATPDEIAKAMVRAAVKSRKGYKGSGNPVMFTTEDYLTDILLMEDQMGRVIYETQDKAATAMRVRKITTVPVMENLQREDGGVTKKLMAIIVNLADYNIGADKGGAVNMFDDFDIDYNAHKYLIETRCSGALIKPYSAIVLELVFED